MQLIAIEGLDFAGKTTTALKVVEKLKCKKHMYGDMYSVQYIKEPDTTSVMGELIYDMLFGKLGEVDFFEYASMFSAARLQYRAKLLSLSEKPDIVLLDRCELSTLVYQTVALESADLSEYEINACKQVIEQITLLPSQLLGVDRIFYLDTSLATCMRRLDQCDNPDKNENPITLARTMDLYQHYSSQDMFDIKVIPTAVAESDVDSVSDYLCQRIVDFVIEYEDIPF